MKLFQILIISFLIFVNPISITFCQDITLSWDPSPTSEVIGYKVHYQQGDMNFPFTGTGAYEGDSPIDVGSVLSTTLTDLSDNTAYFFSVTAYDNSNYESSYSNVVSNSWLPALIIPAAGATNEPIPITFQWEIAPAGYDVTYTLYYGTDQNEVTAAGSSLAIPPASGDHGIPPAALIALITLMLIFITFRTFPQIKSQPQAITLLLIALLSGILTACSGGGGGGDSTSDRSATSPAVSESAFHSINKGSSDYHQAFSPEVKPSTTYYWKVVATDTQDPNLTYKSEIQRFATEDF